MQAAVEGLGVCYLPTFLVAPAVRSGALVPLLAEWAVDRHPVHLLTPTPSRVPHRVQALVKHMLDAQKS